MTGESLLSDLDLLLTGDPVILSPSNSTLTEMLSLSEDILSDLEVCLLTVWVLDI